MDFENLHEIFEFSISNEDTFRIRLKPLYLHILIEYEFRGTKKIGQDRMSDMESYFNNDSELPGTYFYSYDESDGTKKCIMYIDLYNDEDRQSTIVVINCHYDSGVVLCEITYNVV